MQKPNANRERIIELLEHAGGVTEESVREVHQQTGIPEADIWGTGLFYTLLREPGKRIRLCDGLTCQMFGADSLADDLTGAGKTVERVSCLGQCDLAPASLDEEMELVTYAKHRTAISPPQ
ncbi:NAD(P)H-dependent oxidoreductase subunit E [bacterium]|nr:NAD(P)H-dependent oxidoreductase subunit E [bacterium]